MSKFTINHNTICIDQWSAENQMCICESLTAMKKQGEQRIIKLLENDYWHHIYYPPQEHYATKPAAELITAHTNSCIGCELIALIKGKQK